MANHAPQGEVRAIPAAEAAAARLRALATSLTAAEIAARLDTAARRGRLPGLVSPSPRGLFEVRDFGHPFESSLVATHRKGELSFQARILPTMPAIYVAAVTLSTWPGVWLMESFLAIFGGWFWQWTWWWYVPLSIVSGVWALRSAWTKSRATATAEAPQIVEKIAKELAALTATA